MRCCASVMTGSGVLLSSVRKSFKNLTKQMTTIDKHHFKSTTHKGTELTVLHKLTTFCESSCRKNGHRNDNKRRE